MKSTQALYAAIAVACGSGAGAQVISSWHKTPYSYTQSPQIFYSLFARARTHTVRLLMLGDSQETTPGGRGVVYVPRLNFEFWLRYGNCPETPFISAGIMSGPPADWLARNSSADPHAVPVTLPPGWLPPNVYSNGYGTTAVTIGNLSCLYQDATFTDPGVEAAGAFSYLDTSAGIRLEVMAVTSPNSGDVAWKAEPGGADPWYWNPVTQSGTLGLALNGNSPVPASGLTDVIGLAGQPYMQVILNGTDDSHLTTILGSRFRSVANSSGVVITSFSAGGYQTTSFLTNHGASGPFLSSLGFDAVMIGFGVNDAANGSTPQQFLGNLTTLISQLRSWLGSGVPVILLSDPYCTTLTPEQSANYNLYPGAEYLLAQSDPLVLSVNSRRATEELGWGVSGAYWQYLLDGVHYTELGARAKAHAEAQILDQYIWGGCYANCDGSTVAPVLNVNDFQCFLNKFAAGDSYTNCDQSTVPPLQNVVDFQCFLNKFAAGCP